MKTTTDYKQIVLNDKGDPTIRGTTMKVVELISAQQAYGWSPAEIHFQHPYLTMEQVHAALAYYWANKQVLDDDMDKRLQYAERMRQSVGPSPLTKHQIEKT